MRINRLLLLLFALLLAIYSHAQNEQDTTWIRTSLYFGLSIPSGGRVTKKAWKRFMKDQVTPAFPDGSTVLDGTGQWLDTASGQTISERSKVLVVLYPSEVKAEKNSALTKISDEYIKRFKQQSVLRVDQQVKVIFYPVD